MSSRSWEILTRVCANGKTFCGTVASNVGDKRGGDEWESNGKDLCCARALRTIVNNELQDRLLKLEAWIQTTFTDGSSPIDSRFEAGIRTEWCLKQGKYTHTPRRFSASGWESTSFPKSPFHWNCFCKECNLTISPTAHCEGSEDVSVDTFGSHSAVGMWWFSFRCWVCAVKAMFDRLHKRFEDEVAIDERILCWIGFWVLTGKRRTGEGECGWHGKCYHKGFDFYLFIYLFFINCKHNEWC